MRCLVILRTIIVATVMASAAETRAPTLPIGQALQFWFTLGCISFGGPAGQIAIMQTELVDRRGWIDQRAFLRGLNFCTLLPGPEAQQLATYIGWRLHGLRGGIAAGALFVLPGAVLMLALSWLAAAAGEQPWLAAAFHGLKPVVVAIVIAAVWRLGRRALRGWPAVTLAAAAFAALHFIGIDFPWVVLTAATLGWLAGHAGLATFQVGTYQGDDPSLPAPPTAAGLASLWRRISITVAAFVVLWSLPVLAIVTAFGRDPFADVAWLFTKAAFVTFGGAYAVLPYVADQAVNHYGWLSAGEMLNGLALAETTPGPLVLVLQYVGFFAGWNGAAGVGMPVEALAIVAAALTTYMTFLPSFLFIFVGAPYIERLHAMPSLGSALGAINAAIVGVILNLAVFFAEHVFFPDNGATSALSVIVVIVTFVVLVRFSIGLHWIVAAGAAAGVARWLLSG